MTCEGCTGMTSLIERGMACNVTCYTCGKSLKHIKVDTTFTPAVPLFHRPKRVASESKPPEPKKPITRRHWDAMYNKYAGNWGIDQTIKWLNKKFYVTD